MYKVTVNWYENYCQIDESSDFYEELFNNLGPIYNTSKEEVETQIYNLISNLPSNIPIDIAILDRSLNMLKLGISKYNPTFPNVVNTAFKDISNE